MLLTTLLRRLIVTGKLHVIDASGRRRSFGPGGEPEVTIRLHDRFLPAQLVMRPCLAVGEAYMDGALTIEQGTLNEFLLLWMSGLEALDRRSLQAIWRGVTQPLRYVHQYNPPWRSRANVAHHYDLSGALYELFLDQDLQYSCAYFRNGNDSLEQAQEHKKRHIAAKLLLEPGMKVLDIGSGWGGLALHLARTANVEVTGTTLSEEQLKVSRQRATQLRLADRVTFHRRDYRAEIGVYDRVVSVGMFEHVGVAHYRTFFHKLRQVLAPDGVALLHAIGRMDRPCATNPWLRKYIFPGGYCPALSEVLSATEKAGLWVTDVEVLRLHYADTLREWARRFRANRGRVREMYDERFCRMWELYLAGCETAFRIGPMMVFQLQLSRARDAVPLTRDYIADAERQHLDAVRAA